MWKYEVDLLFSNARWLFFLTGVILLKAETRERVAILGVKSSRYLCMDVEGKPFSSVSRYCEINRYNFHK